VSDRYHRQTLLRQIGQAGQARLAGASVLLVGCGALGTVTAEQLVRAGVGFLRIVDRDVVELSNLQRQVLFDEADATHATPKALAAVARLAKINSSVTLDAVPADVHNANIEELAGLSIGNSKPQTQHPPVDLIIDGTDNVATRYLINDVSVKHNLPWIYGAAVGTEGRAMLVVPGKSACLRCIFPTPMNPTELATCDTAGVLSTVSAMIASYQSTLAIRYLVGDEVAPAMLSVDVWAGRFKQVDLTDARRDDCACCAHRQFDFLDAPASDSTTSLCGRDAVQVRPTTATPVDLNQLATKLAGVGRVQTSRFFVRCTLDAPESVQLTIFPDGRALIQGLNDPVRARTLYARFVGA